MPKNFLNQHAFNGGEISPRAYGRKDVGSYRASLRLCKNFIPQTPGAAERRPGTEFLADLASRGDVRLVPFRVSQETNFVLAFTPFKAYVLLSGAPLYQSGWTLNAASSPSFHSVGGGVKEYTGQLQIPGHGFKKLQRVRIENVNGVLPTPLSETEYYVRPQHTINFHPRTGTNPPSNDAAAAIDCRDLLYTGAHLGPFRFESEGSMGINWYPSREYNWYTDRLVSNPQTVTVVNRPGGTPQAVGAGAATGTNAKASFVPHPNLVENGIYLYSDTLSGSHIPVDGAGTGTFDIVPVEPQLVAFDHPYRLEELFEFDYAQDGDVLYITHQKHFPRRLVRRSNQSWRLERPDARSLNGPTLAVGEFFPGDGDTGSFETETVNGVGVGSKVSDTNLPGYEIEFDFNKSKLGTKDIGRMLTGSQDLVYYAEFFCVDVNGASEHELWGSEFTERSASLTAADFSTSQIYWKGVSKPWATDIWPSDSKQPFVLADATSANTFGLEYNRVYWGNRPGGSNYFTVYEDRALTIPATLDPTGTGSVELQAIFFTRKDPHPYVESEKVWVCIEFGYMANGLEVTTPYYCSTDHPNTYMLWHDQELTDPVIFTTMTDGVQATWSDDENSAIGQFYKIRSDSLVGSQLIGGVTYPETEWDFGDTVDNFWWSAWAGHPAIGFPRTVAFLDQRAIYAGTSGEPRAIYGSKVGFAEDFYPREPFLESVTSRFNGVVEDVSAFTYGITSGTYDAITWLNPLRVLVGGSSSGLYPIQASTVREVLTPTNATARISTRIGTREVKPVISDEQILFSSNAGSTIRAAGYDFDRDGLLPLDLTVLADHLFAGSPPKQMALQSDPYPILWVVSEAGDLFSCTYEKEQDVVAWARHEMGGTDAKVKSIVAVPAEEGSYDEVYLGVTRTINGSTKLFIEKMNRFWRVGSVGMDEAKFLDAAINGDFTGNPVTTVGGLEHLEGESVYAMCEGIASGPYTVTNGLVTLDDVCSGKLSIGLPYDSIIGLLPPEIPPNTGNSVSARWKRCVEAFIRVADSHGVRVATTEDLADAIPINMIPTNHPLNTAPPLFTGLLDILPNPGYSRDADLYIANDGPHPLMLTEVLRLMEYAER